MWLRDMSLHVQCEQPQHFTLLGLSVLKRVRNTKKCFYTSTLVIAVAGGVMFSGPVHQYVCPFLVNMIQICTNVHLASSMN